MRWPKPAASPSVRTSSKQEVSGNSTKNRKVASLSGVCFVLLWEVSTDLSGCITYLTITHVPLCICFYLKCFTVCFYFKSLRWYFSVSSAVWWWMLCRGIPSHQRWTTRPDKECTQSVSSWPGEKCLMNTHRGGYSGPRTKLDIHTQLAIFAGSF